jgi:hypothetical protein
MTQQRITEALTTAFSSHSIVFWHDADGEFSFSVRNLLPEGIELLYLDDLPALSIKLQTGARDASGQVPPLQRQTGSRPSQRLAAGHPAAQQELPRRQCVDPAGGSRPELAATASTPERARQVPQIKGSCRPPQALGYAPNDAAGDLDRKMIAVLARAEQPELSGILLRLFSALVPGRRRQSGCRTEGVDRHRRQ